MPGGKHTIDFAARDSNSIRVGRVEVGGCGAIKESRRGPSATCISYIITKALEKRASNMTNGSRAEENGQDAELS